MSNIHHPAPLAPRRADLDNHIAGAGNVVRWAMATESNIGAQPSSWFSLEPETVCLDDMDSRSATDMAFGRCRPFLVLASRSPPPFLEILRQGLAHN